LYGQPGTGKTHTTRYLIGQMNGYTRLLLTGRALHAIGSAAELARDLQPAVVVLEDVDLVAEDRSFGPGSSPVLFDLLDAMEGAGPDADLLFVLTTNRADLLEPALAARPGRVDVAIEIDLPDAEARGRLLALYGRSVPLRLTGAETREIVERMEGVTASFLKELLRRAMLESLHDGGSELAVTAAHTSRGEFGYRDQPIQAGHPSQQRRRDVILLGRRPRDGAGGLERVERDAGEHQPPQRTVVVSFAARGGNQFAGKVSPCRFPLGHPSPSCGPTRPTRRAERPARAGFPSRRLI
jgi:SpoVK/Ycf46/Vps4 family AAA+-type ATPase